eukprot:656804-Hanusia_phi.AAC.1
MPSFSLRSSRRHSPGPPRAPPPHLVDAQIPRLALGDVEGGGGDGVDEDKLAMVSLLVQVDEQETSRVHLRVLQLLTSSSAPPSRQQRCLPQVLGQEGQRPVLVAGGGYRGRVVLCADDLPVLPAVNASPGVVAVSSVDDGTTVSGRQRGQESAEDTS